METQLPCSSGLHHELQKLCDHSCVWECCEKPFEGVGETTGKRKEHNVCRYLREGSEIGVHVPAKEQLVIELNLAALKSGFCPVTCGSQGKKYLPTTNQSVHYWWQFTSNVLTDGCNGKGHQPMYQRVKRATYCVA
ncbi:hypothetical protein IV203_012264 [Nitzschia inconspicua]|uniref:Uncharacterized protein n=1 Tax=Nitzschia inconspicua TaxID=303405 RepID=A0A9K3KTU1_9STRA|nr:hypothetical protein IV203_012264 [Nitzschia inconspicua]